MRRHGNIQAYYTINTTAWLSNREWNIATRVPHIFSHIKISSACWVIVSDVHPPLRPASSWSSLFSCCCAAASFDREGAAKVDCIPTVYCDLQEEGDEVTEFLSSRQLFWRFTEGKKKRKEETNSGVVKIRLKSCALCTCKRPFLGNSLSSQTYHTLNQTFAFGGEKW